MKLIKGNLIQSLVPEKVHIIENGGILLDDDGKILNIFESIPEIDCEIVDYGDRLIMQSFCDMHLHAPQYAMLGMGMDLPLIEWLDSYTFKTESFFKDTTYARNIYRKFASDLIANGTTRVSVFASLHLDASIILLEELEKAGVVGFVGKVNMDRNSPDELTETAQQSIADTLKFIKACEKFDNLKPIVTPRFTISCTNELMAELGKIANEQGLRVQSHLSENLSEIQFVKELHPDVDEYWQTYAKYGLWKQNTLMAHCVHSSKSERAAIKDNGVICVHCPDSNVNLISGICPVREYLNEGIKVYLGSDIAGGSMISMAKNIKQAISVSKIQSLKIDGKGFLSVDEGYYLATTAPQEYFDGGVGFEVGHKLHAIVVDDASFADKYYCPTLHERFERAIYNMEKADIVAVYAEGKLVKKLL